MLALALLLAACTPPEDTSRRGVAPQAGPSPTRTEEAPSLVHRQTGARDPSVAPAPRVRLERGRAPSAEPQPETRAAAQTHDGRHRDLPAELRALIGDPSGCLTAEDRALTSDIVFEAEAHVIASGMVTRASVSSPVASQQASDCVARRLDAAYFRPPVGSTQGVRTSVVLRPTPPG